MATVLNALGAPADVFAWHAFRMPSGRVLAAQRGAGGSASLGVRPAQSDASLNRFDRPHTENCLRRLPVLLIG